MKYILRSIQTLFPFLHDLRFNLKFHMMSMRQTSHEYDFEAIKHFKIDQDKVFIDIGSNRGESILSMLLMNNQDTPIIGFEPNPLVFTKLQKKFGKTKNVSLMNMGLANEKSQFNLYVPFYRRWMFDGLASFKYENAKNWLRTRLWRYDEKYLSIKEVFCKTETLDNLNLKPYFIKIDVQGYELEVLKGGIETIKTYSPIILIESIGEDIVKLLAQENYKFFRFSSRKFIEGKGDTNTFCINTKRHPELNSFMIEYENLNVTID